MHATHLLLEDPIRMASILEPLKPVHFFSLSLSESWSSLELSRSIVDDDLTRASSPSPAPSRSSPLASWPGCRSLNSISPGGDMDYHQETLENLKVAIKTTKKLYAARSLSLSFIFFLQVMLDTVGPELQVINRSENVISLQADDKVVLTPDQEKEASSELLLINFSGLAKWKYWILAFCKYTSLSSQGILSPPASQQRRRATTSDDLHLSAQPYLDSGDQPTID